MKRPRWLGGREPVEDGGDGEATPSKSEETAAERSASRAKSRTEARPGIEGKASSSARKTLGERVGKTGSDPPMGERRAGPSPGPKSKSKSASKGKPASDPNPKPAVEAKPKPKAKQAPARKREPAKVDRGEVRELDRPLRQRDDETKTAATTGRKQRVRSRRSGLAKSLKRGGRRTRGWVAATAPKAGRKVLAAGGAIAAAFFLVLGGLLTVLIAIGGLVARPVGYVLTRIRRLTDAASRLLTPTRALAIVVAGGAVLLALSQYADYRGIAIGNDAYAGAQSVAPAPETGRLETGEAHSYVFVPVAVICLLLLGVALTGRWRLCRLITIAGVAAVLVAIVVDRPAGLDTADAALAFDGVSARLLGGFYAQIAAGILLIGSSTLLARELRLAASPTTATEESPNLSGVRSRKSAATRPERFGPRAAR